MSKDTIDKLHKLVQELGFYNETTFTVHAPGTKAWKGQGKPFTTYMYQIQWFDGKPGKYNTVYLPLGKIAKLVDYFVQPGNIADLLQAIVSGEEYKRKQQDAQIIESAVTQEIAGDVKAMASEKVDAIRQARLEFEALGLKGKALKDEVLNFARSL